MKLLKIIYLVLLIIIVTAIVFVLYTLKKVQIIRDLNNKNEQYMKIENYYFKDISHIGNNISLIEVYRRENEILVKSIADNHIIIRYSDGIINNEYFENVELKNYEGISKIAILNEENPTINISASPKALYTIFDTTSSTYKLFRNIVSCKITTETINGAECYKIDGFLNDENIDSKPEKKSIYVDKETGFVKKVITENVIDENGNSIPCYHEYELKLNCVTYKDLIQPNTLEYEVVVDEKN